MEICRFSRQPNADKFMDFVWDIMESLYYGHSVLSTPDQSSAVAMQTIQTLVDSVLHTQVETTRAMVTMTSTLAALANHFTGAAQPAPAITPQPVTVTPRDYTVHDEPAPTPKPEPKSQTEPTPQKSNVSVAVTPKNEPASTPVTWRDDVYHTMPFNPQPGDRVTIRTWDDMAAEYGLNEFDEIKTPFLPILNGMKPYCGHSYTVKEIFHDSEGDACSLRDVIFHFPLCSLVGYSSSDPQPLPPPSISFDSLLQPLT